MFPVAALTITTYLSKTGLLLAITEVSVGFHGSWMETLNSSLHFHPLLLLFLYVCMRACMFMCVQLEVREQPEGHLTFLRLGAGSLTGLELVSKLQGFT